MPLSSQAYRQIPFRAGPASFILRMIATLLDLYIIGLIVGGSLIFVSLQKEKSFLHLLPELHFGRISFETYSSALMEITWFIVLVSYIPMLLLVLYSAILERSPLRATIAKTLFGLKVVGDGTYNISFGQTLRRNIFKFLPWFFLTTLVLLSLYLNDSTPALDPHMPSIFFAIIFGSSLFAFITFLIPVVSYPPIALHDRFTETYVVKDLDSPRDMTIFFVLVTIMMTLFFIVYGREASRFILETFKRHGYESTLQEYVEEVAEGVSEKIAEDMPREESIFIQPTPPKKFPSESQEKALKVLKKEEIFDSAQTSLFDGRLNTKGTVTENSAEGQIEFKGIVQKVNQARATLLNRGKTIQLQLYHGDADAHLTVMPRAKIHLHFVDHGEYCDGGRLKSYFLKIARQEGQKALSIKRDAREVYPRERIDVRCARKDGGWLKILLQGTDAILEKGTRRELRWSLYAEAKLP